MKYINVFLFAFFLSACTSLKEPKEHRLILEQREVTEMFLNCGNRAISIEKEERAYLIEKINSAKFIGPVKGIVRSNLTICLSNTDTITVSILGNWFKWNKSADWAYELKLDKDYFANKCVDE